MIKVAGFQYHLRRITEKELERSSDLTEKEAKALAAPEALQISLLTIELRKRLPSNFIDKVKLEAERIRNLPEREAALNKVWPDRRL